MEKKVASFKKYEIFMADKSCLNEIANFRNQGELFSSLIFFHRGKDNRRNSFSMPDPRCTRAKDINVI